ncbi:hypothetical protein RHECNPAF_890059 [Rhizobium etli CNPAF512]|nr:hypothetical protein RHECNPAF_890059 [Rhizobium etli CNPAF512]
MCRRVYINRSFEELAESFSFAKQGNVDDLGDRPRDTTVPPQRCTMSLFKTLSASGIVQSLPSPLLVGASFRHGWTGRVASRPSTLGVKI